MQPPDEHEYFIEYHRIGNAVKVTAVDPVTGTEAVVTGAAGASKHDLAQLAVRKLRYILARRPSS